VGVPVDKSTRRPTRRRPWRGTAVLFLSVAVGVSLVAPVAASAADRTPALGPVTASAVPAAPNALIASARASQKNALRYLETRQYTKAMTALRTLRIKMAAAHRAGLHPTTPNRVIAVLGLEHQVAMGLLHPFRGLTNRSVINVLQTTLSNTLANRAAMLKAVIALPQEEASDYEDGMADTLPIYSTEVKAYRVARNRYRLAPQARTALTRDQARVISTAQLVATAFGGGE
jgi:hypothetical protein